MTKILGLNKTLDAVQISVDGIVINIFRPANGTFPSSEVLIKQARVIANEGETCTDCREHVDHCECYSPLEYEL